MPRSPLYRWPLHHDCPFAFVEPCITCHKPLRLSSPQSRHGGLHEVRGRSQGSLLPVGLGLGPQLQMNSAKALKDKWLPSRDPLEEGALESGCPPPSLALCLTQASMPQFPHLEMGH